MDIDTFDHRRGDSEFRTMISNGESKCGYRDFSAMSESNESKWATELQQAVDPAKGECCKTPNKQRFPVKLHNLLTRLEVDRLDHIASWQPHGRCFKIRDERMFSESVLPVWFHQSKFESFQRQMNIYGFCRITCGIDKGCYYHELFLRGKGFLTKYIPRNKVKGSRPSKQAIVEKEPNFYQLPLPWMSSDTRDRIDSSPLPPSAKICHAQSTPLPAPPPFPSVLMAKGSTRSSAYVHHSNEASANSLGVSVSVALDGLLLLGRQENKGRTPDVDCSGSRMHATTTTTTKLKEPSLETLSIRSDSSMTNASTEHQTTIPDTQQKSSIIQESGDTTEQPNMNVRCPQLPSRDEIRNTLLKVLSNLDETLLMRLGCARILQHYLATTTDESANGGGSGRGTSPAT